VKSKDAWCAKNGPQITAAMDQNLAAGVEWLMDADEGELYGVATRIGFLMDKEDNDAWSLVGKLAQLGLASVVASRTGRIAEEGGG